MLHFFSTFSFPSFLFHLIRLKTQADSASDAKALAIEAYATAQRALAKANANTDPLVASDLQKQATSVVKESIEKMEKVRSNLAATSSTEDDNEDESMTVEQELQRRKDTANTAGDVEKSEHYDDLLAAYSKAKDTASKDTASKDTASKDTASSKSSSSSSSTGSETGAASLDIESKYDILYKKLLRGDAEVTEAEKLDVRNSINDDVNTTAVRRQEAREHRLTSEEEYHEQFGGDSSHADDATGSTKDPFAMTGGEMQFKGKGKMTTGKLVHNPYAELVVESTK